MNDIPKKEEILHFKYLTGSYVYERAYELGRAKKESFANYQTSSKRLHPIKHGLITIRNEKFANIFFTLLKKKFGTVKYGDIVYFFSKNWSAIKLGDILKPKNSILKTITYNTFEKYLPEKWKGLQDTNFTDVISLQFLSRILKLEDVSDETHAKSKFLNRHYYVALYNGDFENRRIHNMLNFLEKGVLLDEITKFFSDIMHEEIDL